MHGFTLLETLLVIAIVAVLAMMTVPVYTDFLADNRLKSTAEHLYQNLLRAQSLAIKQQNAVTFVFQTGNNWCYGLTTANQCDCSVANQCPLTEVQAIAQHNISMSLAGIQTSTTFSGSRGTVSMPGTITLTNSNGETISIIINKMGFLRICSADIGGYEAC